MTTTHERLVSTLAELVRCGWRGFAAALVLACAWLALGPIATVSAQELPRVVINEVISENGDVPPLDHGGPGLPEHTDMVELYNDSDELVVLGTGQAATSWFLSDGQGSTFDPASSWQFPGAGRSVIPPGGFLTIFLDGDAFQGVCELHATFALASDGTEPVSLWGPEDENGNRPLVDRIWL
ncbi:MAG TPA: hypothetical protein VK116_06730, partial [Planctomycetota bacterium]|nr:hypothetical protein [Planctomycetota bacterium]